ncbi:MAG: sulfatase-like hydrolase/transferase, partial [Paracoccaceae bacterium]|nr:sulfatase-like hydrolase/transferase [Paracoccaceae bacterium]
MHANRGEVVNRLPLQNWLSNRGTKFERAYTVLPICSPSRASMLTGLYPHNHGLTENDGRFGGRGELNERDVLFTEAFRREGYRCGWFGKWHLSHNQSARVFGFEGWSLPGYGYPYGTPEYADYLQRKELPDPIVSVELPGESRTPATTHINLRTQSDWFDYEAGTAVLKAPAETHEAYFLTHMAGEWLQNLDKDERFFLRVDP